METTTKTTAAAAAVASTRAFPCSGGSVHTVEGTRMRPTAATTAALAVAPIPATDVDVFVDGPGIRTWSPPV